MKRCLLLFRKDPGLVLGYMLVYMVLTAAVAVLVVGWMEMYRVH